jgi:hypothetical protein
VRALSTPAAATPVDVAVNGVGIESKRPYFLSGSVVLEDTVTQHVPSEQFRNRGAEPILITNVTSNVQGNVQQPLSFGDARQIEVGIRQVGNGTNAAWVVSAPGTPNMAQAPLWGAYSGRAVVHEFPGPGLLWEPGEGINVAVRRSENTQETMTVGISMIGSIMVQ